MATLVIVKGLPLSGKTEWAMNWASDKGRVRVSWSDMLQMVGRGTSRVLRPLVVDAACRLMCQSLREGLDVVLDECNLYPPEFQPFLVRAQMLHARVEFHVCEATAEECKRRNAQLGHPVSDMLIDRLAEVYGCWLKQ